MNKLPARPVMVGSLVIIDNTDRQQREAYRGKQCIAMCTRPFIDDMTQPDRAPPRNELVRILLSLGAWRPDHVWQYHAPPTGVKPQ